MRSYRGDSTERVLGVLGLDSGKADNMVAYFLSTLPVHSAAPLDPCENNPCLHGGTCKANGTMYGCSCDQGFTGENCEIGECPTFGI